MESLATILDLELAGVTVRHAGLALVILFATLLLRRIAVDVLLARLHRVFQRTAATWDDPMVETSRSPLRWLITLYGLWLAVRVIATPMDLPELREWLDDAGQIILLFVGAWWVFRLVDVVDVLLRERAADPNDWMDRGLVPLFVSSLRILVLLVSGLVIAQNLGYSVGGLIASLGLGGAAVALASQETIANLFGSVMILADKPFKVGDWIKGDGFEGIVEEIGFRSTRIRTFAQTVENVPNQLLASVRVENVDRRRDPGLNVRRVEMTVGVTYRTSADQMARTLETIRRILKEDPGVDPRMSQHVYFTEFGDSALNVFVYYFTNKADWAYHLGVRERVNLAIMRGLEELGVQVAFPSRSLYIESVPPELRPEATRAG